MRVQQSSLGARSSGRPQHGFEESLKLKRTLLLSILAAVSAALMPLAAACQVAPEATSTERAEPSYQYEVFAGYGYTSLNQVNQSRSGLQGVNLSVTRDWGKHFGITADGAFYKYATQTGNPGTPSVDAVLFGPVVRAPLFAHTNAFVHVLLGGEHTGGENDTPNISFAGGVGGGMDYNLSPRFALRASGDEIASSFSLINNTPALAYSAHEHWNSRAAFGVVYKF
jgi:hypothetical protein